MVPRCCGPLSYHLTMSLLWFPHLYWSIEKSRQNNHLPAWGNLNKLPQNETQTRVENGYILPPRVLMVDYLALAMLCRSLWVCSERSEGTRISTGFIFRRRVSSSERDWPSGKQSSNTSPVLGWTACKHKHMRTEKNTRMRRSWMSFLSCLAHWTDFQGSY